MKSHMKIVKMSNTCWVSYIFTDNLNIFQVSPPDVNPGCTVGDLCNAPWLVHVTANGENDTLHHLWSAVDAPTFMVALTDKEVGVTVAWENFTHWQDGSVRFNNTDDVQYAFGFVLTNVSEFP